MRRKMCCISIEATWASLRLKKWQQKKATNSDTQINGGDFSAMRNLNNYYNPSDQEHLKRFTSVDELRTLSNPKTSGIDVLVKGLMPHMKSIVDYISSKEHKGEYSDFKIKINCFNETVINNSIFNFHSIRTSHIWYWLNWY